LKAPYVVEEELDKGNAKMALDINKVIGPVAQERLGGNPLTRSWVA
jgi:hypothetical protein